MSYTTSESDISLNDYRATLALYGERLQTAASVVDKSALKEIKGEINQLRKLLLHHLLMHIEALVTSGEPLSFSENVILSVVFSAWFDANASDLMQHRYHDYGTCVLSDETSNHLPLLQNIKDREECFPTSPPQISPLENLLEITNDFCQQEDRNPLLTPLINIQKLTGISSGVLSAILKDPELNKLDPSTLKQIVRIGLHLTEKCEALAGEQPNLQKLWQESSLKDLYREIRASKSPQSQTSNPSTQNSEQSSPSDRTDTSSTAPDRGRRPNTFFNPSAGEKVKEHKGSLIGMRQEREARKERETTTNNKTHADKKPIVTVYFCTAPTVKPVPVRPSPTGGGFVRK